MSKNKNELEGNYAQRGFSYKITFYDDDTLWERQIKEERIDRLDCLKEEIAVEKAKNPLLQRLEKEYDQVECAYYQNIKIEEFVRKFTDEHKPKRIFEINYEVNIFGHIEYYSYHLNRYMTLEENLTLTLGLIKGVYCSCPQSRKDIYLFNIGDEKSLGEITESLNESATKNRPFFISGRELLFYGYRDKYTSSSNTNMDDLLRKLINPL
jgi:hypothetical protein